MPPRPPTPRHQAFISFAAEDNQQAGRRWADWLGQTLEAFRVPDRLAGRPTPSGQIPARLGPVGRSAGTGEISAKERTTLVESKTLIVICSPAAAQSARVAQEVRLFKQFAQGRVLALIVAGEPDTDLADGGGKATKNECYPETLRYEVRPDGGLDYEWRLRPVAADLRIDGEPGYSAAASYQAALHAAKVPEEETKLRVAAYAARLEEARRTLIAGVLGVPPAELEGEDAEADRRMTDGPGPRKPVAGPARTGRGVRLSTVIIFLLLAGVGTLGWMVSGEREEKITAQLGRDRANELVGNLQRELHRSLAPNGQFALVAGANDQIIDYLRTAVRDSKEDPMLLVALAEALGNEADLLIEQGNLPAAHAPALEAVETRKRAATGKRSAPGENGVWLIADLRRLATIHEQGHNLGDALSLINEARALAGTLGKERLQDEDVARETVRTEFAAAPMLFETGEVDKAIRAGEMGREMALKHLVAAQARESQARAERPEREPTAAPEGPVKSASSEAAKEVERMAAWALELFSGPDPVAAEEAVRGPVRELGRMTQWTLELFTGPPLDPFWAEEVIRGAELLGDLYQQARRFPEAQTEFREAERLLTDLAARDSKDFALQSRVAKIYMRQSNLLAGQHRFAEAVEAYRPAIVITERLARQQPVNVEAQYTYIQACRGIGTLLGYGDASSRAEALLFFQRALDFINQRFPGETSGRAAVLRREIQDFRNEVMLLKDDPKAAPAEKGGPRAPEKAP